VNVRQGPISQTKAFKLAKGMTTLHAKVGSKVVTYTMKKDNPNNLDLKKALIGRSGDMRAPVIVVGKTMMAGFDAGIYKKLLKV